MKLLGAGALLLAVTGTAGAIYLASPGGGEEEVVRQAETASPTQSPTAPTSATQGQLWRWVNVMVRIPENSKVSVGQDSDPPQVKPPSGGPVLKLIRDEGRRISYVAIDAETGAILRQDIREEDSAEMQGILATIVVSPLDTATAPWPYSGEPPINIARETFGGMSFIRPARDTGLVVSTQINDPGGPGVAITNGKAGVGVYIDEASGKLMVNKEYSLPEYETVFQRWIDAVELCGIDVQC